MDSALDVLLARQSLYELSARYMRGLDRLDRSLLQSVFWDDAYCEYGFSNGSAEVFIDYALGALSDHRANQHMIGNTFYEFENGQVYGEVYFNAYHKVGEGEACEDIIIAGRYLDRYQCREGEWRFIYRSERVDWSHTRACNNPYMALAPDSLFGSRQDDAVYDLQARHKNL